LSSEESWHKSNAFLSLPLKFCGMNQWIFQILLWLLGQLVDVFHG
jgi:hypothetical protein